ncbi:MAG: hypothetical protein MUC62_10770 [Candidatus Thermoplasmatota archaeon]|nr:hypothetical protein [Candidatus Thermoplasmatota archaeon]
MKRGILLAMITAALLVLGAVLIVALRGSPGSEGDVRKLPFITPESTAELELDVAPRTLRGPPSTGRMVGPGWMTATLLSA